MRSLREEIGVQVRLATPIAVTQLTTMTMAVVDLLMVGRVDKVAVGAVALGNGWRMATIVVAQGIIFGLDPFVSQACGARDARGMGLALQRGLLLAVLLSVPVALLWTVTEPALLLQGQDPELSRLAARYLQVQIPSVPFFLAYAALRQYLTGRGILWPALWVTLGANVVNVGANWALIFGHLGLPALGSTGSGIATGLVQIGMAVGLVVWIRAGRLWRDAWTGWDRAVLRLRGLLPVLRKGLPVGAQLGLELWAFYLALMLAGSLSADAETNQVNVAAHTIVLNMASVTFMMPLGVAIAAATRVGNLLGARRPAEAQRAAGVALALGAGTMGLAALAFLGAGTELAALFNDDVAVLAACATVLPIAASFQLFDGVQVVAGGVLRGMGRTLPAALFNLLAFYGLAAPLALWLTRSRGMGLSGIWWALAIGLAVVAVLLVAWIARRGPAHDPRAVLAAEGP